MNGISRAPVHLSRLKQQEGFQERPATPLVRCMYTAFKAQPY